MKTHTIAQTDLTVSRIAYGCAGLAGWSREALGADDVAKAAQVIDTALGNGITLFDHADLYGFGRAEAAFGKVLQARPGLRDQIVLQSKCGQVFTEAGFSGPIRIDVTCDHIMRCVEGSLKRLGTDRLDILLLHVADTLVQPEEVARAFEGLHSSGKVRYFGVSNHNAMQIRLLRKNVRQPIVVNQVHVGLGHPHLLADGMEMALTLAQASRAESGHSSSAGGGTLDYCRLNDIQIQAWSPLRGGLLKGPDHAEPELKAVAQRLTDLARQKQTTPSAVALAWLLRHPAGIVPIIGSGNPGHITENCAAEGVDLTSAEWYDLFASAALKPRSI